MERSYIFCTIKETYLLERRSKTICSAKGKGNETMKIMLDLIMTLKRYTSKEKNILSGPLNKEQIVEKMKKDYRDDEITYKKVRKRLDMLCEMEENLPEEERTVGYRINYVNGQKRKTDYYYNNSITDYEFKFLVDSVMSSMIFNSSDAQQLAKRIQGLSGKHLRDITPYANDSYGKQRFTLATNVLENVKIITEALKSNAFISFQWYVYDVSNQKVGVKYKDNRTVKPVKLILNNGRYLLLARYQNSKKIYNYNVDLMQNISVEAKIKEEKMDAFDFERNFQRAPYILQHPYNMGGETRQYKLRVNREYFSRVVDTFSYEIKVIAEKETEKTVDIYVTSSRMGMKYWLLHNYDVAELIDNKDQELAKELNEAVEQLHDKYSFKSK